MTRTHRIQLRQPPLAEEKLAFFRFGRVGDHMVVTNDAGHFQLLTEAELADLFAGRIVEGHNLYEPLRDKGFLGDNLDLEALVERLRQKKRYLGQGPHLHIVICTLRCNQSCSYCHASRTGMDRRDTDMSLETAKKVVDHAMQSPSPYLNFEFQGGEPTVNMPVVRFIVEYSREKNRYENKDLEHSLVSNLTHMTEETANWLVDNDVLVCASLDGPEELHNANRSWKSGQSAYQQVRKWIDYFNQRYADQGRDPEQWHVDALMTTSRKTFDHWQEVIDLYVELGLHTIHLRPLSPYGFAVDTWNQIGYSTDEYLGFYQQALDYIIDLNLKGTQLVEGTAAVFLMKMLTPDDPNFVDILSPCGAGTGQVAYNYDGQLFTCDEARMVAAMGNDMFEIGQAGTTSFSAMTEHPTVRSLAVASLLDSLPGCESCWNLPFCGVCPMHNYMTSGDLFGQRPNTPKCKEHMAIVSLLLERLADDPEGRIETIFKRWTLTRPREPRTSC